MSAPAFHKVEPVIIHADWDEEANVWVIRSPNVPSLSVEADSIEDVEPKARAVIDDLAHFEPAVAALRERQIEVTARMPGVFED